MLHKPFAGDLASIFLNRPGSWRKIGSMGMRRDKEKDQRQDDAPSLQGRDLDKLATITPRDKGV